MLSELCKRQYVEHIGLVKNCIAELGAASYMFSEVKTLLTLFYVIPGSSATAERSFSALRSITGCVVAQRTVITATSVSYGKNGKFDPL